MPIRLIAGGSISILSVVCRLMLCHVTWGPQLARL